MSMFIPISPKLLLGNVAKTSKVSSVELFVLLGGWVRGRGGFWACECLSPPPVSVLYENDVGCTDGKVCPALPHILREGLLERNGHSFACPS